MCVGHGLSLSEIIAPLPANIELALLFEAETTQFEKKKLSRAWPQALVNT